MARFVIDYFELPTTETAASQAFFRQAFGFGSKDYGPGYSEITDAGVLGGVNADETDRSRAPLIGIRTDDIAAAQRAVEAAGGTITKPVSDYPGGQRFFFREPGGNEMLIYSPSE
jgi:predicted enzyme related to lactoylglutathione lyase